MKIASLVYERKNYAAVNGKGAPLAATDNCYIIRMTFGVDEVNLSDSALKLDLLKPRTEATESVALAIAQRYYEIAYKFIYGN